MWRRSRREVLPAVDWSHLVSCALQSCRWPLSVHHRHAPDLWREEGNLIYRFTTTCSSSTCCVWSIIIHFIGIVQWFFNDKKDQSHHTHIIYPCNSCGQVVSESVWFPWLGLWRLSLTTQMGHVSLQQTCSLVPITEVKINISSTFSRGAGIFRHFNRFRDEYRTFEDCTGFPLIYSVVIEKDFQEIFCKIAFH